MSRSQWRSQVFFTIASNTPGPEASQLQTNRNYGTGGAASLELQIVRTWRSGSSRLRPLSGYAQTTCSPLMGRKPKSADLFKRASQQTSSIDKYFEQKEKTSPSVSPGRQLSEANARQSQKTLLLLINASRSVLCIIVYSITICRGV